jgi:hypothetical protein
MHACLWRKILRWGWSIHDDHWLEGGTALQAVMGRDILALDPE